MSEGMKVAEETQNINYYFVFSINGIYLLLDLGLFDKACELIKKLEENNIYQSKSDKAIILSLKFEVSLFSNKYDLAYGYARELKEYNDTFKIFEKYVVDAYLLETYIGQNDFDRAKEYSNILLNDINKDKLIDKTDLNVAYFALARSYSLINEDKLAYENYKLIYPNYNLLLGSKSKFLHDSIDYFKKFDQNLYEDAIRSKAKLTDSINETLISICNSNNNIYDEFSNFKYEFLFKKMEKLTKFIRDLNEIDDKNSAYKLIENGIKEILNSKFVTCYIGNNDYSYNGLDLKEVVDYKLFLELELPDSIHKECDTLAVIKILDKKINKYLFVIIGLINRGNLETKENTYLISLIRELLIPVFDQIERYNEAVENYSHDELTQLYNRYGFDIILKKAFELNDELYLLMMDIDDFKVVNDKYGHDMGDKVLIEVANTLKASLGKDYVARIGGEEFIGLVSTQNNIEQFLDSILNNIRKIKIDNCRVTISIGVSKINNISELSLAKNEADKKLYEAKRTNKDKYVI